MASLWGKGNWGQGLYSQSQTYALVGNLAPAIAFAADLDLVGSDDLAGNLVPIITFAADLTAGPALVALGGNLAPVVTLAASALVSGPLWVPVEPCDPVDWKESALCDG